MSEEKKQGYTVTFAPGCFDDFDGTQEELDELIKTIQDTFAQATEEDIVATSDPIEDVWEDLSEEEQRTILNNLEDLIQAKQGKPRTLN